MEDTKRTWVLALLLAVMIMANVIVITFFRREIRR